MPPITGTFAGNITKQAALPLTDQNNHEMNIAEVSGTQKSPDPLWHNSKITYWGVTDLLDGKGTQRGYYNNVHPSGAREWGTFEGRASNAGGKLTVEGSWKITGGDGELRGVAGTGKFKTVMKSQSEIDCAWDGNYDLAKAQGR